MFIIYQTPFVLIIFCLFLFNLPPFCGTIILHEIMTKIWSAQSVLSHWFQFLFRLNAFPDDFSRFFFFIFPCINLTSTIVTPPYPRNQLEFTLSVDFFLVLWLLRRSIKILSMLSCVKLLDPSIVAPLYPKGRWFEQSLINTIWGYLHTTLRFSGLICFEKILKDFSIYSSVKLIPALWPHPTLGDHDLSNRKFTLSEDACT